MIHTDCREKAAVANSFSNRGVTGESVLKDLKFIGAHISSRASRFSENLLQKVPSLSEPPHSIRTINDLLTKASQAHTKEGIDRLLEHCTFNRRKNRCVATNGNATKYHTPDVNVCGYNTLLSVLQFAHAHPQDHNFVQNIDVSNAMKLEPRERGHAAGSRYCSCETNQQGCAAHGTECIWNPSTQTCRSRANGKHSGFRGQREDNRANYLGQRIPKIGSRTRNGKTYRDDWRVPQIEGGASSGSMVPELTLNEIAYIEQCTRALEEQEGKLVEGRRVCNFVKLTNPTFLEHSIKNSSINKSFQENGSNVSGTTMSAN